MINKLTPEEIVEYLNKCNDKEASVVTVWKVAEQKPYVITVGDIVDLINRQQEEIERLEKELSTATNHITRLESQIERLLPMLKTKRAEAIKEFAEKGVPTMTNEELNEMINWCRQKLAQEKNNPFGLSGKRMEGYEQAMKSVMSYLHSKKGGGE